MKPVKLTQAEMVKAQVELTKAWAEVAREAEVRKVAWAEAPAKVAEEANAAWEVAWTRIEVALRRAWAKETEARKAARKGR